MYVRTHIVRRVYAKARIDFDFPRCNTVGSQCLAPRCHTASWVQQQQQQRQQSIDASMLPFRSQYIHIHTFICMYVCRYVCWVPVLQRVLSVQQFLVDRLLLL